ncbi:outer membrane lipoprotein chaperone LolA [Thiohalomonas denitrificans]|uniref:Outer-membrane lipoprotein carrier protein n=1 Tax=Thiohalomonas denitrificans TaxID=415747 RepID=A0A1G5QC28_9GAMM|nr:outer membrane lipoprotein chaperone LolA [Thiohalomonas denitrificans]SCZ59146.1 outer membrane lipoprotein carrier protein [Thiohalomonas denitrificans]
MRRSMKLLLAIPLLSFAALAQAGQGQQNLESFLSGLDTMRAEFVQTLVEADGSIIEESQGEMLIKRPGRFRLEYLKPYRQTYVADGERFWMYDHDLEQVSVREQGDTLGDTPAMLLSGTRPLDEGFEIKELGNHEGFTWLELRPKGGDATFESIRLALEPELLRAMEMVDGLGQITRLYFNTVERNPGIKPAAFDFQPPEGVDVVGEGY